MSSHRAGTYTGMNYDMGGTILIKTMKEKDLGVTMNANMKVHVSEQCINAASKGNQVLGMVWRNIMSETAEAGRRRTIV